MSRGDSFSAIVAFHKNSCTFVLQVYEYYELLYGTDVFFFRE